MIKKDFFPNYQANVTASLHQFDIPIPLLKASSCASHCRITSLAIAIILVFFPGRLILCLAPIPVHSIYFSEYLTTHPNLQKSLASLCSDLFSLNNCHCIFWFLRLVSISDTCPYCRQNFQSSYLFSMTTLPA